VPPWPESVRAALPDARGRVGTLQDFRDQPLVLAFYPLDWSPGCSQQFDLYPHEIDEFTRRGARVAAISVDSVSGSGRTSDLSSGCR
jgi:peroxiredoxin